MTSSKRRNQGGTSSDYLVSRIARDRPDILERMKHLEYSAGPGRQDSFPSRGGGPVDPLPGG